jgi:predicted DsbA family dithiol-disulfide isomerase
MSSIEVEVFIDLVCPHCYIAAPRLDEALARFARIADVDVVWRSFQLDVARGRSFSEILVERVMYNHRMTRGESADVADDVHSRLREVAAREGLVYRPEIAGPVDTFDAHRMLHLAAANGVGGPAIKRIQRAYFEEGVPIGDAQTLAMLVADVGIDREEARSVAYGDAYADAVLDDRDRAEQRGIWSLPFFVFDKRYAVSGAQSPTWLLEVMTRCCDAEGR